MERMIEISTDYWTNFINIDTDRTMYPPESFTPNTPEARPGTSISFLIYSLLSKPYLCNVVFFKPSWTMTKVIIMSLTLNELRTHAFYF